MKSLSKLLVVTFLAGFSFTISAKENNTLATLVSIKKLAHGKVQLAYYGKSPENVHVHILNQGDIPVFKETIRSKRGIKKPYNIAQLPYGEYVFKVVVNEEEISHTIKHEAPKYPGNVVVRAASCDESKLKMWVSGPGLKDLRVRVYDQNDRLLVQERIKQSESFAKVYNMEAVEASSVKVVLSDRSRILQTQTVKF